MKNKIPYCRTIFSPKLARKLLKMGFRIVDIAPHNQNPEQTVFYFLNSDELEVILDHYRKNAELYY